VKINPLDKLQQILNGITDYVKTIKNEVTSDDAVQATVEPVSTEANGGALDTGDNPVEDEKPKGFFAGLKDKIGKQVDKFGNKTFGAAISKVKEIWSKQAKLVKYLIGALVVVLAISAVITIIIGMFSFGPWVGLLGMVQLVAAGSSFVATYKHGKKAFESGEGWR
jgi:hypothetical protein